MKHCKTVGIFIIMCVMSVFFCKMDVKADSVESTFKNITWKLEDRVLTISGKGDMPECKHKKMKLFEGAISCYDYYDDDNTEWNNYPNIESIVIEEGITSISSHAFFQLHNVKSIKIPSSVKTIGHAAFSGSGFLEIHIPDSVTSIGEGAFLGCGSLEKVTLPKNIKKIPKMAFDSCCFLKEINIPAKVQSIGESAFDLCDLKEVSIPRKVQTIGRKAFYGCEGLKKVNWEGKSALKKIGADAFSECNIKQLMVPASVEEIDGSGVSGAQEIKVDKKNKKFKSKNGVLFSKNGKKLVCYPAKRKKSVYKIPKGVKTIGAVAFADDCYLKKVIMPDSVTVVESGAFLFAKKLKTVRFSKKLKKIEQDAFICCLTSLKLPNGLTVIEDSAFNCEAIKGTIIVPKNVKEIGYNAFVNAFKVKKIVVKSKKLKKVDKEIVFSKNKVTIVLPKSKQAAYEKFFTKKRQGKNIQVVYQ